MRKNIVLPAVAAVGGLAGLGLRRWELASAFEPSGLPIPGSPAMLVLLGWSALVALVLIALSWGLRAEGDFDTLFAAQGNTIYLTACVLSAFLLLASGGAELVTGSVFVSAGEVYLEPGASRLAALMGPLRIGLCVLGFFCILAIAKNQFRGQGRGMENLSLLGLCLLFCVWLISEYQYRAADPILLDYAYGIFAILTSLLGFYFLAGWSFHTGKPRCTVVFCLLGVYLSLVTMADRHSTAELLRYGAAVLFLTAHAALLLGEHAAGDAPAETEEIHNA